MALSRAGRRYEPNIWPGFVDAMTALLMVVLFVLSIVFVVQSVLRDQIAAQEGQIAGLSEKVSGLGRSLTAAGEQNEALSAQLGTARTDLATREAELARLADQLALTGEQLEGAKAAEADAVALAAARAADLRAAEAARTAQADRATAAETALAGARQQLSVAEAKARQEAARASALQAAADDARDRGDAQAAALGEVQERLTEAEKARLADAAAAEALRARLESSQAELTAMGLALEQSRRRAEETLTLLAAAQAGRGQADAALAKGLDQAQRDAALLKVAQDKLAAQEALSAEDQRKVALLNAQVADLTARIASLQQVLDARDASGEAAELQVADLGKRLNAALLQAAAAEKARASLEAEKRASAEAEAQDLTRYRSEFFGRLSQILAGREGVKVVGDRFVFSSDVVFPAAEATLSASGRAQLDQIAPQLKEIAAEIPPGIDWIIRVDGHTDDTPLSGTGRFRDNWELSQARALAVVRYLVDAHGFPPDRLAAAGFGEFRPAVPGSTPEARAANRRIELKLTER